MCPCIIETRRETYSVLWLGGEFDIASRRAVRGACQRLGRRRADQRTVLDLAAVTFIDCGTIGQLAGLARRRHAVGDACVTIASRPFLLRLLEITGFSPAVPVVPDLSAALEWVGADPPPRRRPAS